MNSDEILSKWYADLYDMEETQTDDIEFMLSIVGIQKQDILEVCCGSGRILIPLAAAGHHVTGFDKNEYMMAKIEDKAQGFNNIRWYKVDAVTDDWGQRYDVVVLAGNIMINIETDMVYKEAQELFIQKAYDSLKQGGHIYLDFNLFANPETVFEQSKERVIFEGTDHSGNYGKFKIISGEYNCIAQMCTTNCKIELQINNDEMITKNLTKTKHIPTLENVMMWLKETGFEVEEIYGDYQRNEISEFSQRAIIWAKKGAKQI